ncbi:hypothetical protein AAV94_00815, partial [Lampropedia cohaerens]
DPRTGQEKTQVAVMFNGIFNDIQASAKYAVQNYIGQQSEPGGQVDTRLYENIHLINNPPAASTLGENMVAVYQKMLEGLVGEPGNSTEQAVELGEQYGQQGLFMGAHSRGSLTVANALGELQRRPGAQGVLKETDIKMVGPAANVANSDRKFGHLQGQGETARHIVLENSALDFVGSLIGLNPATGDTNLKGKSWWSYTLDIFGGDSSAHNCYGFGNMQCQYDGYRSEDGQLIMHPGQTIPELLQRKKMD